MSAHGTRATGQHREQWTDEEMLRALHARDHVGIGPAEIARLSGRSRGSTTGILWRIDRDTDKHDLSPHLNGTMPPKWWAKGLRNR